MISLLNGSEAFQLENDSCPFLSEETHCPLLLSKQAEKYNQLSIFNISALFY